MKHFINYDRTYYLLLLKNLQTNSNTGNTGANWGCGCLFFIIILIMVAIALPCNLSQVGRARESEGKNAVGTINRSQQAYHFENWFNLMELLF